MPGQELGIRFPNALPARPLHKTSLGHEAHVPGAAFNLSLMRNYFLHLGAGIGVSNTGWQREMLYFHLGRKIILQKKVKALAEYRA